MSETTTHEPQRPVPSSSRKRWTLLVGLILTTTAPAALLEEGEPVPASSDGRVAACGVVTEDGVTEHLDAYADRCGEGE